jgi:hypothetical protein
MAGPIHVVPDPPKRTDPIVAQLTDFTRRDEAFREILSRQLYRSRPRYVERIFKPLRHVVVCPQANGPPLYAVFPVCSYEQRAEPLGYVILIDADGAIIPWYINANSLDEPSEFRDINGDTIVDAVDEVRTGKARILHVLPVTREQRPTLMILLRRATSDEHAWSWRLAETAAPGVCAIELGPGDPKRDYFEARATYQWSPAEGGYVGPPGGDNLPFKRMKGSTWPSAEYDAFVGHGIRAE